MRRISLAFAFVFFTSVYSHAHSSGDNLGHFVRIQAKNKFERSKIADLGMSIEAVRSDSVFGIASESVYQRLLNSNVKILEASSLKQFSDILDFPREDSRFHNYAEMTAALDELVAQNPKILKKFSIGKSLENRDIWAIQINTTPTSGTGVSVKPGAVFMGNHHAREHVSAEIPLMFLQYLMSNYGKDAEITRLVDTRDTYIIPMVNPDGVEFDISTGRYKMQRKNMRSNGTNKPGVDLNRNYGYMWNHGGASSDPSSETYMGPAPFSEPETQAIKNFVESKPNLKVLLTFHTFSELILYPWGHKYGAVEKADDKASFVAMAQKMANWNGYTPEQSSELYIASGDTVDWAYGALGIFAFTFELSPRDMWSGGFYPGADVLDKVFSDNLKPCLYLLDLADNPHRSRNQFDASLDWLN